MTQELFVKFEGLDLGRANKAATEMRQYLLEIAGDNAQIEIRKDNPQTQDLGSVLVLVLGTPVLVAIAKGIRDFIAKSGDSVIIATPNGKVIARGSAASNIDIAKTAAAMGANLKSEDGSM